MPLPAGRIAAMAGLWPGLWLIALGLEVMAGGAAAWVAGRGEGERNRGLFWAACRLAENGTPSTDALDALGPAAAQAGLSEREITTTVRSAYRATQPTPAPRPSADGPRGGADRWRSRSAAPSAVSLGRAGL